MGLYVFITPSLIWVIKRMNGFGYENIQKINGFSTEFLIKKLNTFKNAMMEEFLHGGHLVSLAAPALAISTMILLGLSISWVFLFITYFGTLCIYNYDYIKGLKIDYIENVDRSKHIQKYQNLRLLLLFVYGFCFLSLLFYYGNLISISFGVSLLVVGLAYTDIFKRFTKKIPGFKNIYTSISFSMLIFFTPIFYSYQINVLFLVFFVFVLLQFIVDTSFCDLKDMKSDKKHGLKTLPILFGRKKFLLFLYVVNLVSFTILMVAVISNLIPLFSLVLVPFFLYRIYYINKAKNPGVDISKLTSLVDAEYFFWPMALLLVQFII